MIALMVGGRASRMGRGVISVDCTKGLMRLPVYGGGSETLIDRTLRLLKKIGAIVGVNDVLMCVGYKAELVTERYPEGRFLKTYDPDNPTDTTAAYPLVFDAFPHEEHFIFIMGDTVWSEKALRDYLSKAHLAPLVFYHSSDAGYTDIYGTAINGKEGREIIHRVSRLDSIPIIPGEIRWKLQGITRIPFKDCREECVEQWMDQNHIPGMLRVNQCAPVKDIDWDEGHQIICQEILEGKFGK
jgi:hypothetical protein